MNETRPRIVVLGTGGTIAGQAPSATDLASYKAAVASVDELVARIPELAALATIEAQQLMNIGSKNLTDEDLVMIARSVQQTLRNPAIDGVVVTHGTDTLEETAYFLNLVVSSEKPVVVVGAMRPATALSADGPLNLYDAIRTACSPEARGKGVLVVLNGTIFSARDVTKQNAVRADAFTSPIGPLGAALESRIAFYRSPSRRHTTNSQFAIDSVTDLPEVALISCHAGVQDFLIDACIARGVSGLVLGGTGNANYPDRFLEALRRAAAKDIVLVRASRVGAGSSSRKPDALDAELGMVVVDDQSAPRARLLLALGLAARLERNAIQSLFDTY